MKTRAPTRRRGQEGFTLIEILIALLILITGIAGVLTLQMVSVRATNFSRHATEAAVLGEEKLEELRVVPVASITNGTETVDEQGVVDASGDGFYTRTWTITDNGDSIDIVMVVSWLERGSDPYDITLITKRRRAP